jgi:uncharacterized protein
MPIEERYEIIIGRDAEDVKQYGKEGTIFLGKHVVGEGEAAHLTNTVRLDVARPHVYLIVGKRGSGKSSTGAVIAEEIAKLPQGIKNNLSVLLVDVMGIFWSMKNPNDRDLEGLSKWGIKPQGFDVDVVIPLGLQETYEKLRVPYDKTIAIRPSDLRAEDWIRVFGLSPTEPLGILLTRLIKKLPANYTIENVIDALEQDQKIGRDEKYALQNLFAGAHEWGIFGDASDVDTLLRPGRIAVLDLSYFGGGSPISALLVGLVSRQIYEKRIAARREEEMSLMAGERKRKIPLSWIILDEVHEFVPNDRPTAASDALITLAKQGRQPGIGLILISQRPFSLHVDTISQADVLIAHRVTAKPDVDALGALMQTYLLSDIRKLLDQLPRLKGAALVIDDNSERIYTVRVRPRQSWHAGGTPTALKETI